jgi:hypothetical protein
MRLPPNNIQILLPVWGARYTRDFLDLCLPSLLAPGNIPALSKLAPCTLVLLVTVRDAATIRQSPLWDLLQRYCEVRVEAIDDFVSESASTVLTLGYTLAIRTAGHRAIDTCFVPLVADYVLSDGSLLSVVERIFAGASGVLAGNFQVEREKAVAKLEGYKNDAGVLAVTSQALVELSLGALHQTTLAEVVDAGSRYYPQINRLFWRVDERCMVGRFFLMHMIAIRPETSDFIVAAPSDYSLIPELCPSGNIVRMTDSDDYLAVECQPRGHRVPTPTGQRLEPRSVAGGLALWATSIHRENAGHALVFHSGSPSSRLAETVAVSGAFVSRVDALGAKTAMPFRHHPLWLRALDHHAATALAEQDPAWLAEITADPSIVSATGLSGVSRLREIVLGRAPYFRPWHPRWLDARALKQSLAAVVSSGRVAVVADVPARVRLWLERTALAEGAVSVTRVGYGNIPSDAGEPAFDCCLFLSPDLVSAELSTTLSRLAPLVKPGGAIVLGIGRIFSDTVEAPLSIVPPAELIIADGRMALERTDGVAGEPRRLAVQRTMMEFARKLSGPSSIASFLSFAMATGLASISLCYNRAAVRHGATMVPRFTSLFFTFRRFPIDSVDGGGLHRRDEPGVSPQLKTDETVPVRAELAEPGSHLERMSHKPACGLARAVGSTARER